NLEQYNKLAEAKLTYETILKKWPNSILAEIGLGNIAFAQKKYNESVDYLKKAANKKPAFASTWYNLSLAQAAAGMKKEADDSSFKACQLAFNQHKEYSFLSQCNKFSYK
ncbi:MAG: hypothetical protein ACXVCP_14165, partial [Bdellovibrio sp.]